MNKRELILEEYYDQHYKVVHSGRLSRLLLSFSHRGIERGRAEAYTDVLEVACGNGQHFNFVRHEFSRYIMTDIANRISMVSNLSEIPSGKVPKESGVFFSIADARELQYPDETFDRIISTCLLLHYCDPMPIVRECIRVLKPGGVIDALIPNDTNVFVRSYQRLVTNRKASKRGISNIEYLRAIDHQSSPRRTMTIISNEVGETVKLKIDGRPFGARGMGVSCAYLVLRITKK